MLRVGFDINGNVGAWRLASGWGLGAESVCYMFLCYICAPELEQLFIALH